MTPITTKGVTRVTPDTMRVLYAGKSAQTVVKLCMMGGEPHIVFRAKGSRLAFPLSVETAFRSAVRNKAARDRIEKLNKKKAKQAINSRSK